MSNPAESASRHGLLRHMVEEHYRRVYAFAYRLSGSAADADDVTQQTFLQAQRRIDQLRDPESARSWLFTIARNVFLKTRGKPDSRNGVSLEAVAEPTADTLDTDFDGEALQNALNELTDEYRIVLVSYYFRDQSYKEIAEALGIPIGTVMSRLSRAKTALRRSLGSMDLVGSPSASLRSPQQPTNSAKEDVS